MDGCLWYSASLMAYLTKPEVPKHHRTFIQAQSHALPSAVLKGQFGRIPFSVTPVTLNTLKQDSMRFSRACITETSILASSHHHCINTRTHRRKLDITLLFSDINPAAPYSVTGSDSASHVQKLLDDVL